MKKKLLFSILFLFCFFLSVPAQQVLFQGWYWDYPKTAAGKSWADSLRLKAAALKTAGITHIWFPPHTIASFGTNSNGYDPKDLFIGSQTSGLGTRTALNSMLSEFTAQGIAPVADMVYNHRDGGNAEVNPPVKDYITNHYTAAREPFPSDRFRCILPLGGSSGNGAGDYYFKIASKTGDGRFNNFGYKVYMHTNTIGYSGLADQSESEPNGGGDCGQANNSMQLGRNMNATVETSTGCNTDEFHLSLSASDFNAAGDTLFIYLNNSGGYSDHRIYGLWSGSRGADIAGDVKYQTYTDFSAMPSGRGQMNYEFFKPNSTNASSTFLSGDWDGMYFFYDYDQFQARTRDTLINWTKWNWTELGVRGLRMDAVKHFTPAFIGAMLNSMHADGMDPSLVVGEWYDTNAGTLSGWVNDVKASMDAGTLAAIQPKVFDFTLRENLRKACDDGGFDVRNIFNGSLRDAAAMSGFNVVTFVNNHDFRDASGFASLIQNNPDLAYAYILTNNQLGVPTIFYPDYYGYPAPSGGLYSYHPASLPAYSGKINRLLQVLDQYVDGAPGVDYLNRFSTPYSSSFLSGSSDKALVYQLEGSAANGFKDVIVAINFGTSTLQVDHGINNRGGTITSGTRFSDVLGHSAYPYALVNGSGQVYLELPPKSYSVWVQGTHFVLPLTLKTFTAREAGRSVLTTWEVTDNEEALRFELQRGANSNAFKTIGIVDAVEGNGDRQYNFTDKQPVMNEAMLYRLKIHKRNGDFVYSDLRMVRMREAIFKATVALQPGSSMASVRIQSSTAPGMVKLEIISPAGKVVAAEKKALPSGLYKWDVYLPGLAAGVYHIRITSATRTETIRFLK